MTTDGYGTARSAEFCESESPVTDSSRPGPGKPQPERFDVTCDSWDHFEDMFRRRLDSGQVFVPSVQPPPIGTQIDFRLSIPDGTAIDVSGRVVSSVAPAAPSGEPSSAERAGMIVEFGKFARAEEKRVRALLASLQQRKGASSLAPMPVRSPSTPSRAPSTPPRALSAPPLATLRPSMVPRSGSSLSLREDAPDTAAVLERLENELAALQHADAASQRVACSEDDLALAEARWSMELHQYPEAIRLLVAVLDTDPDKLIARVWLNLAGARHARELGQDHVAADCYRVVLALQPDHPEAQEQLAELAPLRRSAPQLSPGGILLGRLAGGTSSG
jgi:hypothetical protein